VLPELPRGVCGHLATSGSSGPRVIADATSLTVIMKDGKIHKNLLKPRQSRPPG
jgi:hypothetical protein